jgi:hypothetical protein
MSLPRRMKLAILVLVLAGCAGAQHAQPATVPATATAPATAVPEGHSTREERCRNAARACGAAILSAPDDRGLDCMADEAIAHYGGRATIAAALAKVKAEMTAKGVTIENAEIDLPQQIVTGGGKLFAVLGQRVTMKLPEGHLRTRSFLLAVSSDDGQTWKFVDGARLTREKAVAMFPTFPQSLALPEVGPPERLP